MTAQDYKITFPYNATTAPYSVVRPHKGNDRKMPVGVPIVINSVVVAYSGQTGSYNGVPNQPHLHTQAGTDQACQNTVDPTPYEFKPGTVVALRTTNENQWGKYITIKTLSGMYITYAHLSQINVTVGQVIGGDMHPTHQQVSDIWGEMDMGVLTPKQQEDYVGRPIQDLYRDIALFKRDRLREVAQVPSVTASDKQIDETINAGNFAAFGVKPEQIVYDTYRPLLRNNYVEGNLTMLAQFYADPNSLANKTSTVPDDQYVPVVTATQTMFIRKEK